MSKNRINLYTQEFKPKRIILSLAHMSLLMLLGICILIATLSFIGLKYQSIKSESNELAQALTHQQSLLIEQEAILLRHQPAKALVNQVKQLQQLFALKQSLLTELSNRNKKAKKGYAALLRDLAKTDKGSLWLTHIYASGEKINLLGESLNSDAIPHWLIQFKDFPALSNKQFNTMQIWRNENQQLVFSLTSITPDEKEDHELTP